MYQKFDDVGGPSHGAERVRLLRLSLAEQGLAGFIVPRADEHQNEYVPPDAERLLWLTGFSGSWGVAAVLTEKAALLVDGRYTLQAAAQTDPAVFEIVKAPETKLADWLDGHLREGDRLGYDPRLHTMGEIKQLAKSLAKRDVTLVALDQNPVTALWRDRPPPPSAPVSLHPIEYAGLSAAEKIADIQRVLRDAGQDAVLITALDSLAWLFNMRGGDLPHTPFVLGHGVIPAEGKAALFVAGGKLSNEVRAALSDVADIAEPDRFMDALAGLGRSGAKVRADPGRTSQWIGQTLTEAGASLVEEDDPCILPKARKNSAEIAGARAAHRRDGVAVCRFLKWLDEAAPQGDLDEIGAAERLEAFRRESPELREVSFDSIAGSGPHGAIVHYRVTRSTNRKLEPDSLFLIDSGGQYIDGTTDITRTVAIGQPSLEMRRHFTLVLKGHIAIAVARFPIGTRGCDLDVLARRALWEAGLDYDHGTGHGVGSYLSVHEGPQGLSKRSAAVLEPGMILSNEPGYYREGAYGIRIENLLLVKEPDIPTGGEREMLSFETLTFAPMDRYLIDTAMLTSAERDWVNAYHAAVQALIGPKLNDAERRWFEAACAAIV